MSEQNICRTTYKEGHSQLGTCNIRIWLVDDSHDFLLRRRSDGANLLAIPKANLLSASYKVLNKEGLASELAILVGIIPFLEFTHKADWFYNGVQIGYWDQTIGREELLFLDTKTYRNARRITAKMWAAQATYLRQRTWAGQLMR